ncbi:MAG: hypothetical protein RSF68_08135 [Myroides sp.]
MKNLVLFLFIFSVIACSDDNFSRSDFERQRNNEVAEKPPEGLKIKHKLGFIFTNFHYHSNGFVDSTYTSDIMRGYQNISEKFIYNKLNKIVERTIYHVYPYNPQSNKIVKINYRYNLKDQIVLAIIIEEGATVQDTLYYKYNQDGSLINPNKKVINENLVEDGYRKHQFDSFRNPYYNLYPKAYRIINYINKNNILKTESIYGSDVYVNIHTLKYNSEDYIIEEHISDMGLDTDDHREFIYH